MSADPRMVALRHAREDNRNEVSRLERHEHAIRDMLNARHERRMQALMPSIAGPVEDFGTWVTL